MCAIAGLIDFQERPIDLERVISMARVQAHRGPDGEGMVLLLPQQTTAYVDSLDQARRLQGIQGATGALAHRRLAIIDLSGMRRNLWQNERAAMADVQWRDL
jgi:asparagine synthetase B (glutamine-hydrolysing)